MCVCAAVRTEGRPADVKKVAPGNAPHVQTLPPRGCVPPSRSCLECSRSLTPSAADSSRSKSTTTSSPKRTVPAPGAALPAGGAPGRVKPASTPVRPSGTPPVDKKPMSAKPSSSAPRVGLLAARTSASDLKSVRCLENNKHQPGGGRVGPQRAVPASSPANL